MDAFNHLIHSLVYGACAPFAWAPPAVGLAVISMLAGPGIAVETEPVRVLAERQVSWRIRPSQPVSGDLRLTVNGDNVIKRIEAGSGFRSVPGRRVSSRLGALWHPDEPRIEASSVEWVD